ncbi:MAG: Glycerol kinase [Alphaproteobacteria bacterium MarineAlpha9_Bin3]|nr:MAG: Glycerol kinase [Alphaproteobacteria bacterium MarineAlpha9_Bin3]|tara:strand:+ start:8331 stop:9809 length:1479 start_codon:yes stop_codon:yes gene_type:complete
MKKAIIAIDQGTSSSRAVLFDLDFSIIHIEQKDITTTYPSNGWVEQDANEIWNKTLSVTKDIIFFAKEKNIKIISIGITNQRETIIAWNKITGEPLYNAIIWQDRRTKDTCDNLIKKGLTEKINAKTGLLIDPYFSATKISWILKNIDNAKKLSLNGKLAVGTIDSFLLFKLTDGKSFYTDATNASRTSLYNIHENKWDDDLLDIFKIPINILPEVTDNIFDYGNTNKNLVDYNIPINAMIGDQQAAAIGQNCLKSGDIKATFGTGCFILLNTGDTALISKNKLLSTIAYKIKNNTSYALEGSIFISGASMKWLKDELGIIKNVNDSQLLASTIKNNNGVYFVPAFTGLGAPHWKSDARGTIVGLTASSGKAEIVRAALEAVAYQSVDLFDAMTLDGQKPNILRVDGAMSNNDWLIQFLSSISKTKIERSYNSETTSQGAAILSSIGSGILSSLEDSSKFWKLNKSFNPKMETSEIKNYRNGWNKAIKQTTI